MPRKSLPLYELGKTYLNHTTLRTGIHHPPIRQRQYATRSRADDIPSTTVCGETLAREEEVKREASTDKSRKKQRARRGDIPPGPRSNSASASRSRSFLFSLASARNLPIGVVSTQKKEQCRSAEDEGGLLEQLELDFLQSQKFRISEERNSHAGGHKTLDRKAVADPYARMIASPIRRCAVTGAKLPKDFMIRLRQVSVSFPSPSPSNHPSPPPAHASSTTKYGQFPATRKTYLVPFGLVTYPPTSTATEDEVLDVGVTKNMREEVGRSVGKSKYVLCRADTFSALLGRKKDRKSLGQESEISPLIVEQITEQLQQRVLVEFQNVCEVSKQQRKRRGEVYDCVGEAGGFEALTSQEQVDVLDRSRIPPRLAERGIYAFLDLRDAAAAAAPAATPPRNKAEELRYSDVPILYLRQQTDVATNPGQGNNSSSMTTKSMADSRSRSESMVETMEGELTAVPLFKIGSTLLGNSLHQSRKLLHGAIQSGNNLQEEQQQSTTAMIALCSPLDHNHSQLEISEALESNSFQRGTAEGTAGVKLSKEGSSDGIPLFIALWRLRLWSGMGWTISDTIPTPTTTSARDMKMKKDDLDGQTRHIDVEVEREEGYKVREQTMGQVVQGFQVVQGVMHGKWM